VHPFIAALDEENPETRKYVSERLREWTKEIIGLGRYDLVDTIVGKLAEQLRIEATLDLYESLVTTLADIAISLLSREKHSYVERITGILADYLRGVKDQPQGKMLVKALGQIGDKTALKELVSLLGSTELDGEAGRWIVSAGNDAIRPLLRGLRIVEDKNTRLRMVEVASELGEEILPAVIHELKDSRWYVRRNACTVLSKLPAAQAMKQLSRLLHDSVPQVREEAIVAISRMESEEIENLILPMTMDKESSVQRAAIDALGEIGTESSVTALISFLQTSRFRKRKESLRSAVLKALGAIGGQKAKEFLMEVVTKRSWRGSKYSEEMRKKAIEILGKLGGVDCRVVLLKATKDKSHAVKAAALMTLRKSSRKDTPIP
jgi:HEAT repeat protein